MGVVFEAEDVRLQRKVALKFLPAALSSDRRALERFRREARAASALNHPNICTVFDIGEAEAGPFIVMEALEGENLKSFLSRKRLDPGETLEVAIQIADALDAAHSKGIVHRDIKPANIFVTTRGLVKVLDFGLAKLVTGTVADETVTGDETAGSGVRSMLTLPGSTLGTTSYMSPEQVLGRPVDIRSDVFSFGVVLYEMATGRKPFTGAAQGAVMNAILSEKAPPPAALNPALPAGVVSVIDKCLEKDPSRRYRSCGEVLADLKAVKTAPAPEPKPAPPAAARRASRRPAAIDSIAVLPFSNQGGDARTEYLSDGIPESLINALSHVRKLRVIARSTVQKYRGKTIDPIAAGRELNVRAVIAGRVLELGDTLLVGAELVNVEDGSQLWGQQYSRKLTDLLAVQEEVARDISDHLHLKLSPNEKCHVTKRHTENTEAYRLYLKGRYHWNERRPAEIRRAIEYFESAIESDPSYALAWAGLADSYALLCFYDVERPIDVMPKARAAASKAQQMDPQLAEAHASLGMLTGIWDFDWKESTSRLEHAIRLNPGYAPARHWHAALLSALGQHAEAEKEIRSALAIDPLSLGINADFVRVLLRAGQVEAAIEQSRTMLRHDPGFAATAREELGRCKLRTGALEEAVSEFRAALSLAPENMHCSAFLGHALALAGQAGQARDILQAFDRLAAAQYVPSVYPALVSAGLGDRESALRYLEQACRERYPQVAYLQVEPAWESVRPDPRFAALAAGIGLGKTVRN